MQDFADAAHAVLADLRSRVGLDAWWLCRRQDDVMVVLASVDDMFGRRVGMALPWECTFSAAVLDGAAPQVAPRAAEVEAFRAVAPHVAVFPGAVMVMPVYSFDGTLLGTLCGAGIEERDGLEAAAPAVSLAAGLLGALLSSELRLSFETRRADSAEKLSYTDGLTKVGNRAAWDRALATEEARSTRYASSASVVVLDLNGLKETNDRLGHELGDQRLCQLATLLTASVRPSDVVARLGGDEFGVLLPETGSAGAGELVVRLRTRLAGHGLSVSVGAASRTHAEGLAGAWQRADAAMYKDKRDQRLVPAVREPRAVTARPLPRPKAATTVDSLLALVRRQLHADVAFISTFSGDHRRFRNISADIDLPFEVGTVAPRVGSYCDLIVDGHAAAVIPDTSRSVVGSLPATAELGIGSHVGVALHRADGRLYGTLCAFSQRTDPNLQDRDAEVLRSMQTLLMGLVEAEDGVEESRHRVLTDVEDLMRSGGPAIVYQPVFELESGRTVGQEALSRFPAGTPSPAEWFQQATVSGVGPELELMAISNAAKRLPALEGYLALNVSPETACLPSFARTMRKLPLDRVVVEITEHAQVDDYGSLMTSLTPLRVDGLRVAVDDTGAGFASMRHVLALMPDYLKLDISLTRNIDRDAARQALAASLTGFAAATGASVIAEGVETADELLTLRSLGIQQAQGYHLAKPRAVDLTDPDTRTAAGCGFASGGRLVRSD